MGERENIQGLRYALKVRDSQYEDLKRGEY
jgi:hypothetical protein